MSKLKDIFESMPKYYCVDGATPGEIASAEKALTLKFSEEYKEFLNEFGSVSFDNHEINGLNVDDYLNVVTQTENERKIDAQFSLNHYVIENIGIEGILILSDNEGYVFEYSKGVTLKKIADSLYEYICKK